MLLGHFVVSMGTPWEGATPLDTSSAGRVPSSDRTRKLPTEPCYNHQKTLRMPHQYLMSRMGSCLGCKKENSQQDSVTAVVLQTAAKPYDSKSLGHLMD
jgi:hypothetical protein